MQYTKPTIINNTSVVRQRKAVMSNKQITEQIGMAESSGRHNAIATPQTNSNILISMNNPFR